MADSKNKRTLDDFVEDLDDLEKSLQQVVDSAEADEQTIERLLVDDSKKEPVIDALDDLTFFDNEDNFVLQIDDVTTPELTALDRVEPIEEFHKQAAPASQISDQGQAAGATVASQPAVAPVPPAVPLQPVPAVQAEKPAQQPESAAIAKLSQTLGRQIEALKQQLEELAEYEQQIRQDLTLKASKDALANCLDSVNQIKIDFERRKRLLDNLPSGNPPPALYLTSGLSVLALIAAIGFGWQSSSVSAELESLKVQAEQHQQQLAALPASDAVNQALRGQVDDLTLNVQTLTTQLAELAKVNHGSSKSSDDLGRQLTKLSNQSKQLADSLEALGGRVVMLEKFKPAVVLPAKTEKPADLRKQDRAEVGGQSWLVTLVGSKHDWYAQRKADEYAAKGFPVKIIRAQQKGETWYRLVADGFKTQQDADGYAARVRKSLNLDTVTVGRN